jgi:hypothetical protein
VLGPVKLETIVYHFFQDKFYAASLHTQERDDTLNLCCALRSWLLVRETNARTRETTSTNHSKAKPLRPFST